ncbi:MAG: M16 family metallopeptidase, partial [Francisellaceae bacterium]
MSILTNHLLNQKNPNFFLSHNRNLPMFDIRLCFAAGSIFDGDKKGLAQITADMVACETQQYNEDELIDKLTLLGASLTSSVNSDYSSLTLRSLSDASLCDQAVDVLCHILSDGIFSEKIFHRTQADCKISLNWRHQNSMNLAFDAFNHILYDGFGYDTPTSGTKAGLDSITLEDVIGFYRQHYTIENAKIIIVGDIDEHKAAEIEQRITQSLHHGQKRHYPQWQKITR